MKDYTLNKDFPLTKAQNNVVEWMLSRPVCINACQTGLGKTYTCLTAITHLLLQHPSLITFILAPPKALKVFRKELETKLKVTYSEISSETKANRNSRIFLVSQTQFDKVVSNISNFHKSGKKILLLIDEAHCLANPDNNITKLVYSIRRYTSIFWLATATPCGQDIWTLYNLMYLINPQVLGSREQFTKNYLITQLRRVKKFNPITRRYEFPTEEVIIGTKNLDQLQFILKDYLILKQNHYNLQFIYHTTQLTPEETVPYLEASAGLARKTSEKNFAVRLNDLQRVVDNCSPKYSNPNQLSSKEKLLITTTLQLIKSHAIIIYTDLQDNITRLLTIFNKLKDINSDIHNIYTITGADSFQDRAYVEDHFTTSDIVLITSAGSESINLQASDTLILYDVPFSIKTFIQLVGRITRINTKHDQQYIHFIETQGTIDTYRRLNVVHHSNLITDLFGDIETLPLDLTIIDGKTQQKLRNKLLWSFRARRLPTEQEIQDILNNS